LLSCFAFVLALSKIDHYRSHGEEHTNFKRPRCLSGAASIRQHEAALLVALFLTGNGTRKRKHVPSGQVPSVLVVDDEHVIASTLAAILRMHGYSATYFTCAVEALAAARSRTPDLLISVVAMPGSSGIDLAIQMRAQYPTCKILPFSGQAATFDLLEHARAQGHHFDSLLKPVPTTDLLFEVGKMINGVVAV
jgi:CheY-like chemotaxis protein